MARGTPLSFISWPPARPPLSLPLSVIRRHKSLLFSPLIHRGIVFLPLPSPPRNESCDVVNGIDGGERESARVFLGGLGTWGGNQVASNERTNWLSAMSVPSLSLLGMLFPLPDEGASVLILPPRRQWRREGERGGRALWGLICIIYPHPWPAGRAGQR